MKCVCSICSKHAAAALMLQHCCLSTFCQFNRTKCFHIWSTPSIHVSCNNVYEYSMKKLYILQYTANMQHTCSNIALYNFIIISTNLMVGNVFFYFIWTATPNFMEIVLYWNKKLYMLQICSKYAANMQQHCCIAFYCKFYSRKCFLFLICTFSPNFKQIG